MQLSELILFFLAGLGVFNGLLLAVYCVFYVKPLRRANVLFSLLLFSLCIRIGKSILHTFYDLERIWLQVGLSACILIGPTLFVYIRSFQREEKSDQRVDKLHLITPFIVILTVGFIRPYALYPEDWNGWIVPGIYLIWISYTLLSIYEIWPLIVAAIYRKEVTTTSTWLLLLVGALALVCLAYNLALCGFPYLVGPLLFSMIFYLLFGFLLSKQRGKVIFYGESLKYSQAINPAKAAGLADQLAMIMHQQQLFLHPKIKLAEIAEVIDSTPHELSRMINERMGISFNQYINKLRIEAACNLLLEADHLTIEGIGQEVGFTSRSAFYQSFKAFKQETPARYKARASKDD